MKKKIQFENLNPANALAHFEELDSERIRVAETKETIGRERLESFILNKMLNRTYGSYSTSYKHLARMYKMYTGVYATSLPEDLEFHCKQNPVAFGAGVSKEVKEIEMYSDWLYKLVVDMISGCDVYTYKKKVWFVFPKKS